MIDWSAEYLRLKAERRNLGSQLNVVVCSHSGESIDGFLRYKWTKESLSSRDDIRVLHAHNVLEHFPEYGSVYDSKNPQGYGSDELWGRVATEMLGLGKTIDYLFASEDYGPGIAKAAGAKFIACDKDRESIPVSGTEVRDSPMENWDYIPPAERSFFAKKVCLYGAEFTGADKLARHLANHFRTVFVPEYADKVYDHTKRHCTRKDLDEIAISHIAGREALLKQTNKLLISDTDVLTTAVWYQEIFGTCPSWIKKEADRKVFDLYLFMEPTGLRHKPGNTHKTKKSWLEFSEKLREALDFRGWPYIVVSGNTMKRQQTARTAINNMRWDKKKLLWLPGEE